MAARDTETMTGLSLRVPKKTRIRMAAYDFVNWSVVMRDLLDQKLDQLDSELWSGSLKGERCE